MSALDTSGGGRLLAVAAVAGRDAADLQIGKPCGCCRKLLYEAGGPGLLINQHHTFADLLPDPFGADVAA